MKRSERIEKINAINNGIKSLAGVSLAKAENDYRTQLNQLEQLRIYKDEYATQLKDRLDRNVSADQIKDYRYFFASLYKAISQQESIVSHLHRQVEDCRHEWLERDRDVRKLNTISDNLRKEEDEVETRREQKRSDENAMQMQGRHSFVFKH